MKKSNSYFKVQLVPFEALSPSQKLSHKLPKELQIQAKVERKGTLFSVSFELRGQTPKILFPPAAETPSRLDSLWQKTCFEAFLSWEENRFYYELNASPSGDWNFYRFEDYRKGQVSEAAVEKVTLQRANDSNVVRVSIQTDLGGVLPPGPPVKLKMGLAAVIEWEDHQKSYWAVKHAGKKADFHLRESFVLEV